MNENIYSMTNNLLDSLFDEADKDICSNFYTYKNQTETLPDDYTFDFSEFEDLLNKTFPKFNKIKTSTNIQTNKSIKKKTLIINFIGEPGAGKSWAAWYLSAKLKQNGFKVEYLPEFAKSKLYEHSEKVFTCESYIFGKQLYKMHSMSDEVDIIVTDSPIILPHFYEKDEQAKELLKQLELYHFNQFNNLNICLLRDHDYKKEGRFQTEIEAEELHNEIMNFLMENHIDYYSFFTSHIESEHFWKWLLEEMEGR